MKIASLSNFLTLLGNSASSKGLKLLVLRNYRDMPGEIYSRDIDVLVCPEDIVKWMDLLTSICNSLGLELKKGPRYLYCHACFIEGLSGYPGGAGN